MIKIGIIGFGKMGQIRAKALEETGGAEIRLIHDESEVRPPNGANTAASHGEILHSPDIDAVFICTPNFLNKPLAIAALEAGKHVFCEKPPAFTAADVEQIRLAETASGKTLMYGFNHRHHDSIRRMKQILDKEELGRLLWMRGRYGKEVDANFFRGWRANPELAGGGIMLDQGIHMLDLMLHLGGGFDQVHAFVSNLFWQIEGIEDNVFAILKSSETGVCASLHSTMTQWRYLFSLEVFCEKGAMVLNGLKTSSGVYGDEDLAIKRNASEGYFTSEERMIFHEDTSWRSEVSHFINCIETASPVTLGNSCDALRVMTLLDGIYGRKP